MFLFFVFFFSSRRRHTRLVSDWSSDVCSSDLSSRWVESASFLRLQNITVEYALDLPFLTNSARSARLYVSADNLFVITGYSGLDPEVSSLNESDPTDVGLVARGIDYLSYPRPRAFTGGLRVAF